MKARKLNPTGPPGRRCMGRTACVVWLFSVWDGAGPPRPPAPGPPRPAALYPCPACVPHAGRRRCPGPPVASLPGARFPPRLVPSPVSCFLRLDPSVLPCLLFLVLLLPRVSVAEPLPALPPSPQAPCAEHRAGGHGFCCPSQGCSLPGPGRTVSAVPIAVSARGGGGALTPADL